MKLKHSKIKRPQKPARSWIYELRNFFGIVAILVSQSGCVNLMAVRNFASVASQTQEVQAAASELEDSPQRQAQYSLSTNALADFQNSISIGRTNKAALLSAYGIVQNYMTTLATLAGDGIVASNNAVSSFSQTLASQRLIRDTNALDAYGKLASLMTRAMTDGYRREKIKQMIEEAEPSFPLAVSNLQHVVAVDCVLQLRAETNMLTSYYIISSGLNRDDTPRWAKRLVLEIYNQKMAILQNEIADCNQCAVALGKIAAGYNAMYEGRNHLDAKELESVLNGYGQGISDAMGAIKQLK